MHCHCFSTCTEEHALAFLSRLPPTLTSASSPWYAYLLSVYRSPPALPFPLRRLTFFHLSAALPMARCVRSNASSPLRLDASHPRCAAAACAAWLAAPAAPPAAVTVHRWPAHVHLIAFPRAPPRAAPRRAWVEVHRARTSFAEGVDSYGCWFYPVVGSGLWVNIGRTTVLEPARGATPAELDADLPSSSLFREFVRTHNASEATPPPAAAGRKRVERFPALAHLLGYDSVQVLQRGFERAFAYPELVITTDNCSHQRKPIRTCPPHRLATGARHELSCTCSEKSHHLNCDGGDSKETEETAGSTSIGQID
ncbi:hypothetical protein AB1Y20_014797 [Prymnesium parvum]|uniref:Uncharacterized protein n=1 Tax=Prymnesium parvum TaxID=97485 RepID=A0AB34IBY0_PRYPA